uniref:Sodium/calcium exchanger membrane region n=1 Tax=Caulobacter sp. (strain K31) TaxID=366602 RepID=B0SUU5_CAUSK
MSLSSSQARQLWIPVGLAVAVMLPALALRIAGWRPNPVLDIGVFGAAILAAGFLLSWGAEAAEKYLSQGLILAAVALVTVLPEYAVDIYYAFQAGRSPSEGYVAFAAANMTGANRLLIGLAWPAMVLLHWWKNRQRGIELAPVNAIEIVVLALSSAYAFVIILKNTISAWDAVVLVGLFGLYLWRVSKLPKAQDEDEGEEPGPGAVIAKLSNTTRWTVMIAMTVVAAGVILVVAEPFAESMIDGGRALGIDQFLLIQWLAPIASEAPAVVIAVLFVLAGRAAAGLVAMISDKINQWTLLVGMLPLAMSLGAGQLRALPLDARQHEEFFLTAAQSLFGLALLLRLRLSVIGAIALLGLFVAQLMIALSLRQDEARDIAALTAVAWGYLVLAGLLFALNWRAIAGLLSTAFSLTANLETVADPHLARPTPSPERARDDAQEH